MTDTTRPTHCPRDHTCPSHTHHDNIRGYWRGCRSRTATTAITRYEHDRRERTRPVTQLVDATGATRKLQALAWLGHPSRNLAARVYMNPSTVQDIRAGRRDRITPDSAASINTLWVELSETEPLTGRSATLVRRDAEHGNWAPVEAWDHTDIDDPDAQPWQPARSEAARHLRDQHITQLAAAGHTDQHIAWTLGCSTKTVERVRLEHRHTATPGDDHDSTNQAA